MDPWSKYRCWNILVGLLLLSEIPILSNCRPVGRGSSRLQRTFLDLPYLQKSQMCRCINRPDPEDPDKTTYLEPNPNPYKIDVGKIDLVSYPIQDFPRLSFSVCVYLAQLSPPDDFTTHEILLQALNEHGWPTGHWFRMSSQLVCQDSSGTRLKFSVAKWEVPDLDSGGIVHLHSFHRCYEDDFADGFTQGWLTEEKNEKRTFNPKMVQFWNKFEPPNRRRVGQDEGMVAFFKIVLERGQLQTQAKRLKFVAEVVYGSGNIHRLTTPTYDVTYDPDQRTIGLNPTTDPNADILWNPDFYYQVHGDANPRNICLPLPPPPPPFPKYPEVGCRCFVGSRKKRTDPPYKQNHARLDITNPVFEYPTTDKQLKEVETVNPEHWKELLDFIPLGPQPGTQDKYVLFHVIQKDTLTDSTIPSSGSSPMADKLNPDSPFLAILYKFKPAYSESLTKEREFVMSTFGRDVVDDENDVTEKLAYPLGTFLDPYFRTDEAVAYASACDAAAAEHSVKWVKPPFQALVKCQEYDDLHPDAFCFHFHSDYFFLECLDKCKEPKYVCAVWKPKAEGIRKQSGIKPFMFQFMSTSVFYKNQKSETTIPVGDLEEECPAGGSSTARPWKMTEHLPANNKALFKLHSVWEYNENRPEVMYHVQHADQNSNLYLDGAYLKILQEQANLTEPDPDITCLEAATYFLEVKDNNLCLCTFWGDNLGTWQTHYGRGSSCHSANKTPFTDYFKIEVIQTKATDTVIVRVYMDPAGKADFIMHAVYMQGLDQLGIPVGTFREGHFGTNTPACPNDLYSVGGTVSAQTHPTFQLRTCPHVDFKDLPYKIRYSKANLFLMQNVWKDSVYDLVCASFTYRQSGAFTHVTHIQFIAFVRIEDIKGDHRSAYFVELRSEVFDAADFTRSSEKTFKPEGSQEDRSLAHYPPLNYNYFRLTLKPYELHWERDCLPPAKVPVRLYSLCRWYVSSPSVQVKPDGENLRIDLDRSIDKFNILCPTYLNALNNYGTNHQLTVDVRKKLEEAKLNRDKHISWKECFELKAFRTRRRNAVHVKFRVHEDRGQHCLKFGVSLLHEASMVALNEDGYPSGRAGGVEGGSFEIYNHFNTKVNGYHEHCEDDDIQLSLDDVVDNHKMVFYGEKGACTYKEQSIYKLDYQKFHQWWDPSDDWKKYVPSLMIWANVKKEQNGFCAIWFFPAGPNSPGTKPDSFPKSIQFVMEVFFRMDVSNGNSAGDDATQIITIRSPKYQFDYDAAAVHNPSLVDEAKDPANLDGTGPTKCHDVELTELLIGKPNDACKCNATKNSTAGEVFCLFEYANFNNIFDSSLYRQCLDEVDRRYEDDEFLSTDCRTRLEYPQPPEIFPNELIKLDNQEDVQYDDPINFAAKDPTDIVFEGCGLIKQCASLFANDKVEDECISKKSCPMIVAFGKGLAEYHNMDEVTVEIYAVARGWAAVGISSDEMMGEDYVVECCKEGGEVNLYNSWNTKTRGNLRFRGDQGVLNKKKSIIRPVRKVFFENKLYCKFYIKKKFTRIDPDLKKLHEYNMDNEYYYIMAYSHALSDPYGEEEGNIRSHVENGLMSEKGHEQILAGQRLSPLPIETRKYRAHGGFMIVGWMFFVTMSIFLARYFKETFVNFTIMKLPFWYLFHVTCAVLSFLCLAAGTALQILAAYGWKNLYRSNFHTYTAYLSCCFYILVFFLGFFLKKNPTAKRRLLNWVHVIFGHISYLLAMLNLMFAARVAYGFLTCQFLLYMSIWVAVYFLLHAAMSYHYCWVDYIYGRTITRRRSFSARNIVTQTAYINTIKEGAGRKRVLLRQVKKLLDLQNRRQGEADEHARRDAPGTTLRTCALVYYVLCTGVYTFWAVRKMWSYARHCYDFQELKDFENTGFN